MGHENTPFLLGYLAHHLAQYRADIEGAMNDGDQSITLRSPELPPIDALDISLSIVPVRVYNSIVMMAIQDSDMVVAISNPRAIMPAPQHQTTPAELWMVPGVQLGDRPSGMAMPPEHPTRYWASED